MAAAHATLFNPGANCYRAAPARRAALLVDGKAYFRAFAQAALRATRSIVIVGWDFHSQTRLHLNEPGVPDLLGEFLNCLVARQRRLEVFILTWDCPFVFAKGRESPTQRELEWRPRRRVRFRYDSNCPLGSALHQKIVVIDGAVAFCGGMDLTLGRWDTPEHRVGDPRRMNPGETDPYGPIHDTMLAVDGQAARELQSLVSQRWRVATGKPLPPVGIQSDPWPTSVPALFSDVDVALARTVPPNGDQPAVAEVQALYLDMIAAARRYIYLENQYFTAQSLGEALAARLAEPQGPEVVVVLRLGSSGWLEARTMEALRTVLLHKLRAADRFGRLHACYPSTEGASTETCCDVHSKLMIVDDEWLRVGSANFANRSLGLDTECDLAIEARGESLTRAAIASVRDSLLAEHLDVGVQDVRAAIERTGTLGATIDSLARNSGRTLKRFERLDEPPAALVALAHGIADPGHPVGTDKDPGRFIPDAAERIAAPLREPAGARVSRFLGGKLLGKWLGTLVATVFARQFAPAPHDERARRP